MNETTATTANKKYKMMRHDPVTAPIILILLAMRDAFIARLYWPA